MSLAAGSEAGVERDQSCVPAEGGRQCRREQGSAQRHGHRRCGAGPCVVRCRRRTGRARPGPRFLTADLSKFGHADDQRQCGALAETGDAQHRSSRRARSSWPRRCLAMIRICAVRRAFNRAMSLVTIRRSRGSSTCSSLTLKRAMSSDAKEGQISRQSASLGSGAISGGQPQRRMRRSEPHRARRSAGAMYPRISLDLDRLQHQHGEARRA